MGCVEISAQDDDDETGERGETKLEGSADTEDARAENHAKVTFHLEQVYLWRIGGKLSHG